MGVPFHGDTPQNPVKLISENEERQFQLFRDDVVDDDEDVEEDFVFNEPEMEATTYARNIREVGLVSCAMLRFFENGCTLG